MGAIIILGLFIGLALSAERLFSLFKIGQGVNAQRENPSASDDNPLGRVLGVYEENKGVDSFSMVRNELQNGSQKSVKNVYFEEVGAPERPPRGPPREASGGPPRLPQGSLKAPPRVPQGCLQCSTAGASAL